MRSGGEITSVVTKVLESNRISIGENMRFRLPIAIAIMALTLTACGGGDSKGSTETDAQVTKQAEVVSSGAFGSAVEVSTGVTVTLDGMADFTPGKFATGYVPGDKAVTFDVTVNNGSAAEIYASSLALTATSGDNGCVEVFDGDNGLEGAPSDPIAAGASSSFKWAITCGAAKSGDPLKVELSFDGATAIEVSGTLV